MLSTSTPDGGGIGVRNGVSPQRYGRRPDLQRDHAVSCCGSRSVGGAALLRWCRPDVPMGNEGRHSVCHVMILLWASLFPVMALVTIVIGDE